MTSGKVCKCCGDPLIREKWNSTTDVDVCDNYKCDSFRRPISTMNVRKSKAREFSSGVPIQIKHARQSRGFSHDPEDSNFTESLQRLRSQFQTKK